MHYCRTADKPQTGYAEILAVADDTSQP